jgi:hypothetical protein
MSVNLDVPQLSGTDLYGNPWLSSLGQRTPTPFTTLGSYSAPTPVIDEWDLLEKQRIAAEGDYEGFYDKSQIRDYTSGGDINRNLSPEERARMAIGTSAVADSTQRPGTIQPYSGAQFQQVLSDKINTDPAFKADILGAEADLYAAGVDFSNMSGLEKIEAARTAVPKTAPKRTVFETLFGKYDPETKESFGGVFTPVTEAITGIGGLMLGKKQYDVARDTLKFQKDAFNKNYGMQIEMINRSLGDRERARQLLQGNVAGADQASRDYVEKYGVKGN